MGMGKMCMGKPFCSKKGLITKKKFSNMSNDDVQKQMTLVTLMECAASVRCGLKFIIC